MAKIFHELLEEDEAAALDFEHARVVSLGEGWHELTESMEPGQICRVSTEQYTQAYLNKYSSEEIVVL